MKHRFTQRQSFLFFLCYVGIICLALIDSRYRIPFLRYPLEIVLYPVQQLEIQLKRVVNSPIFSINNFFNSQQTIDNLQSRNTQLLVQNAEALFLKKENEDLRAEIERRNTQVNQEIFVKVSHIISLGALSYLDKGERDGVHPNDLVMSKGVLLGTIKEVNRLFSSALFFSEGAWEVVAKTETGVKGIIEGEHGKIYFTQVPADQVLEKNQLLVTVGNVSDAVPPGLFIGVIEQIIQEPGQPFQMAVVNQSIDLNTTTTVEVVRW